MPNNEKGIDLNDAVSEQEPTQQRSIVLSVVAIIWGGSCVGSQDFPTVLKAYFEPSTGIANLATGIVLGFSLALSILYVRGLIHRGQASIDARYDIEMFWTAGPLKAGF